MGLVGDAIDQAPVLEGGGGVGGHAREAVAQV